MPFNLKNPFSGLFTQPNKAGSVSKGTPKGGLAVIAISGGAEASGQGPGRSAPVPSTPQHPSWTSPVPLQPPDPPNEEERLKALRCLGVLDSKRDPQLDFVTEVATEAFQLGYCTISLLDQQRQWFKAAKGFEYGQSSARRSSFCTWILLPVCHEVMVVEDATKDARFRDNYTVTAPPYIRFYCAAPLVSSNGERLGTLCCLDTKVRQFGAEQYCLLCNLAELVVRHIERKHGPPPEPPQEGLLDNLYRRVSHLKSVDPVRRHTTSTMLVDLSKPKWPVLYTDDLFEERTGLKSEAVLKKGLWDVFTLEGFDADASQQRWRTIVRDARGEEFCVETNTVQQPSRRVSLVFRPSRQLLDANMPQVGIPCFVPLATRTPRHSYYFVMVNPVDPERSSGHSPSKRGSMEILVRPPFLDLKLGPMISQTTFGSLFRGIWAGATVAVKIVESLPLSGDVKAEGECADAASGAALYHPNIVASYGHRVRKLEVGHESLNKLVTEECLLDILHSLAQQPGGAEQTPPAAVATPASGNGSHPAQRALLETWMLREYCDMGSLQDAIDRGWFHVPAAAQPGPLPDLLKVLDMMREIASAIAYMHTKDIIHGNLTGSSIMLCSSRKDSRGFTAKVADFELSRVMHKVIESANVYGNVTHMPPELINGGRLTKAADVWSFGVLLWEMYMGQRYWRSLKEEEIVRNVGKLHQKPEFPEGTSEEFKQLAIWCLNVNHEQRPSFDMVGRALATMEAMTQS